MRLMLLEALKDTTAEVLRNLTSDIQSVGLFRHKLKSEGEREQGRYFDEAVYRKSCNRRFRYGILHLSHLAIAHTFMYVRCQCLVAR